MRLLEIITPRIIAYAKMGLICRIRDKAESDGGEFRFQSRPKTALGMRTGRGSGMQIKRFQERDAGAVAALVERTLRETNSRDYSAAYIEGEVNLMTPKFFIERSKWTHFYVAWENDRPIGCGAVGPYWGREDESSFFTIFVLPEFQGRGVGRSIVETLEADPFFQRARRVEISASITACGFYRKMGYDYKNGNMSLDSQQLFHLEKYRGGERVCPKAVADFLPDC